MFIGWIIILLPALRRLFGIRQIIKAKTISRKIMGTVYFIILVSVSVFLLILFDGLSTANDMARLEVCKQNLKKIGVAVSQYKQENGCFPTSLEAIKPEHSHIECPGIERNGPSIPYTYKIPAEVSKKTIICWDSKPHKLKYKYLKFRNKELRNILRLDGTVETVSEHRFNELKVKHDFEDIQDKFNQLQKSFADNEISLEEFVRRQKALIESNPEFKKDVGSALAKLEAKWQAEAQLEFNDAIRSAGLKPLASASDRDVIAELWQLKWKNNRLEAVWLLKTTSSRQITGGGTGSSLINQLILDKNIVDF